MTTGTEQQTEVASTTASNPIAGYVDCPLCAPEQITVATVLVSKRNRKYLNCPVHNIQLMTNNACQQWIHKNMRDTPQRKAGDPKPTPAPDDVKPPKDEKPTKAKQSAIDVINKW